MSKDAVVFLSDLHINSTLGLCRPGVQLDDGGTYQMNDAQRWLWGKFTECLNDVDKLIDGYHKTLVLVGDVVELDSNHRSWQMISRNPTDILFHAVELLDPLTQMFDDIFIVRGTEAHTGRSAWGEEQLAKDLDAVRPDDTNRYSWWHLRAEFGGVTFDVAHHMSMGTLPHTYANAAMKLSVLTAVEYTKWGEIPPDYAIRAHNHVFADSGRTFPTRAIFLPAWQFKTAYMHRIGKPNALPHIGAVVVQCEDGDSRLHDLIYIPKRSKPWKRTEK